MDFDARILQAAEEFFKAATECGRADRPEWLGYPEVVNYAFAAELALKGLHWVHRGQPSRGHDLEKLCMALPPAVVAELGERTGTGSLFAHEVTELRNTFADWRYAFEREQLCVSLDFLAGLASAAIDALRRDAPIEPEPPED